jgi:DNA-binding response OmpR family regulator
MSPSVLVVEDYADLCSAIVDTLVRRDYDCESAATAEDAIGKLRTHHYQTILLSPRIPIKDDPVMRFLHDSQPEELPKVILMTAPDVDEDLDVDECPVLCKPFNLEQLFAKLTG